MQDVNIFDPTPEFTLMTITLSVNYDEHVLQLVQHKTLLTETNEFFSIDMLTDLNNKPCLTEGDG